GDRSRLHRPDPDGQVPVALLLFQQDDRAVGRHLDTDADDLHPPHWSSVLARAQRLPVPLWAPGPLSEPNHSSCQTTPVIDRKPSAAPSLRRARPVMYPDGAAVKPVPPPSVRLPPGW